MKNSKKDGMSAKKAIAMAKRLQELKKSAKSVKMFKYKDSNLYSTTDYKKFNNHRYQRNYDEKKTNKIIKSILEYGYIPQPLIVNENFDVMVGKHRLEAEIKLGLPVYYLIADDLSQKEIVAIETGSKWKADSKLESATNAEVPVAMQITKLLNEINSDLPKNVHNKKSSKMTAAQIIAIVLKNPRFVSEITGIDIIEVFKNRKEFTTKELNFIKKINYTFLYQKSFCAQKGIKHILLQQALLKVVFHYENKFNFESYNKKLSGHVFGFADRIDGYVVQIIDLYNKKKKIDKEKLDYFN